MATKVSTRGSFRREPPGPLFSLPDLGDYDVTADGQRFLVRVKNPDAPAREIHVVLNWFEKLKARVVGLLAFCGKTRYGQPPNSPQIRTLSAP